MTTSTAGEIDVPSAVAAAHHDFQPLAGIAPTSPAKTTRLAAATRSLPTPAESSSNAIRRQLAQHDISVIKGTEPLKQTSRASPASLVHETSSSPSRDSRRAATPTAGSDSKGAMRGIISHDVGQKAGQEDSLATEILQAPPTLPTDPSYFPLDPEHISAWSTAPAGAHPQPTGSVIPATSTTGKGAGVSASQDKKKRQPVYSLAKPADYEGKVPWPLFAIVNGRPEADAVSKRKKRRTANNAGGSSPRPSRSSTPAALTATNGGERNEGATARAASISSTAATSTNDRSPLQSDMSLPHIDEQDSGIATSSKASTAEPDEAQKTSTSIKIEDLPSREGSVSIDVMGSGPLGSSDDSNPNGVSVDEDEPAGSGVATLDDDATSAEAAAAAAYGQAAPNARQLRGAASSSSSSSSSGQMIATTNHISASDSSVHPEKSQASRNVKPHGQDQAPPAMTQRTRRASTPASSLGPAVINGEEGPVASGSRPTRAAAAKVAAKGSYYNDANYSFENPAQAALVHTSASPAIAPSTLAARKAPNGVTANAASKTVARTASVTTKGKEKEDNSRATSVQQSESNSLDERPPNDDFCATCGGGGHFICCDSCTRSFHFVCFNPPLDINEVPLDDDSLWHCRACTAEKNPAQRSKKGDGIFAPLLRDLESQNPSIFTLPPDIKNAFKGIVSHPDGSYVDTSKLRPLKADRKGMLDERDPFKLRDARGKEVLCYRCGGSALPAGLGEAESIREFEAGEVALKRERLRQTQPKAEQIVTPSKRKSSRISNSHVEQTLLEQDAQLPLLSGEDEERLKLQKNWRRIASCDYCPLHWHLDCVDPPMANMPSNISKWRCPCHIEELLTCTRIPKSSTQLQVIDLPVPTLQNTGWGPGQFYRPRVTNSGQIDIVPDPLDTFFSMNSLTDTSGRNLETGWTDLKYPAADAEIPGGGIRKVRFRIPEKVVRTDWWMKVLEGGNSRLVDAGAAEKRGEEAHDALAFLASIAAAELDQSNEMILDEDGDSKGGDEDEDAYLLRLAIFGPSNRVQPPSVHVNGPTTPPRGFIPNGKLKREEDAALPESSMRGSLHLVDEEESETDTTMKIEGANSNIAASSLSTVSAPSHSKDKDISNGSVVDEDAQNSAAILGAANQTPKRASKRLKLLQQEDGKASAPSTPPPPKETGTDAISEEELASLRAVRELLRKKGEKELLAFLHQGMTK